MITLYYADEVTELSGNITGKDFNSIIDLAVFVTNDIYSNKPEIIDRVFLLSFYDENNKKDLIFISEHFDFIIDILTNTHKSFDSSFAKNIFIQEYKSFESAYSVALTMKEPSHLAYDPE